MKVKVNVRKHIEDHADHRDLLLIHAGVDIDDLFETNDIPEEHEFDIDIHELLRGNRQIAHILSTQDVREVRPDLNHDQAWEVLQEVERRLDSRLGVRLDTLLRTANYLYLPGKE